MFIKMITEKLISDKFLDENLYGRISYPYSSLIEESLTRSYEPP